MFKSDFLLYQDLLENVKVSQVCSHISFWAAVWFKWAKIKDGEGINRSRF